MEKKILPLKCKDCPYYTGVRSHGHGEYWGECGLMIKLSKEFAKYCGVSHYSVLPSWFEDSWGCVCDDDSSCHGFVLYE